MQTHDRDLHHPSFMLLLRLSCVTLPYREVPKGVIKLSLEKFIVYCLLTWWSQGALMEFNADVLRLYPL